MVTGWGAAIVVQQRRRNPWHHTDMPCSCFQRIDIVFFLQVVPPEGWATFDYERQTSGMVITPIMQAPMTQGPGQIQLGIQEGKPMTFSEFKSWAESPDQRPPMDTTAAANTVDWKKLERRLWGSLSTTAEPPRYGSDNLGTLFPAGEAAHGWNIDRLDTELQLLGDIPGVTRSMLYFGA